MWVTVFVASIVPGPSMLLALTHGIKFGARGTVAAALGNVAASLVQAVVTIAGLGAVLTASETLFMLIKWCGAAYLIWTGIGILRSTGFGSMKAEVGSSAAAPTWTHRFMQSFWVAAGNPKAVLFFTALFPQFINIQGEHLPQYAAILATLALIAFGCFMIYAQCGEHIASWLRRQSVARWVRRVIGGTFLGLGAGMALSDR